MYTIAIVNEKGGTGKTTTSVSLSAALGEMGRKVLLVDLDGQAAASRWVGVEDDSRLAEALGRGHGLEPIPDVLPGVWLAPSSGKLDSVSHDLRPTQGGQLRKVLAEMESFGFEFVLIDCPPSLGNRLIGNALLAATHVIVPVETSILALDGLKILLTTLDDVRDGFGHELFLSGVLACRYDVRTRLSRLVLAELRRALPGRVFETIIRENVRMRECPASGESILTFAGDSHAAEDYRALAKELLASPEKWFGPLTTDGTQSAGTAREESDFCVDDLRSHAAAVVRANVRSASWRKSEADHEPDHEPEPEETDDIREEPADADADAPAVDEAGPAAADGLEFAVSPAPVRRFTPARITPVEELTDSPTTPGKLQPEGWDTPAPAESPESLRARLARLAEAKQRLEAEQSELGPALGVPKPIVGQPEVPVPPAEEAQAPAPLDSQPELAEPVQPAEGPQADPAPEPPPQGASNLVAAERWAPVEKSPEHTEKAQPGEKTDGPSVSPEATEDSPAAPQADPSGGDAPDSRPEDGDYPALRAYLEKLRGEGKLPAGSSQPGVGRGGEDGQRGGFRRLLAKLAGKD